MWKWMVSVVVFGFSEVLLAVELPDCWSNPEEYVKGSYILRVEVEDLEKEDLVKVLKLASGKSVRPSGYPLIFDDLIFVTLDATGLDDEESESEDGENDDEVVRGEVEAEVEDLVAFEGVTVECNGIMRPVELK